MYRVLNTTFTKNMMNYWKSTHKHINRKLDTNQSWYTNLNKSKKVPNQIHKANILFFSFLIIPYIYCVSKVKREEMVRIITLV